jgi:acetyl-CoA C-acetyltransferase
MNENIYIINYKRSPIGGFLGSLSSLSMLDISVKLVETITKDIKKDDIKMAYIGNVLSTGLGQNIARQITYKSGLSCPSISLNRICSSGMQAIIECYKSLLLDETNIALAGGVESMSNSPHYINIRNGVKFGNINYLDTMLIDGLTDPFDNITMGQQTEKLLERYNITRSELDEYAKVSYQNARYAYHNNNFNNEILPIELNYKKQQIIIKEDEEVNKVKDLDKITKLKPAFIKNGLLTSGNSSKLSDGACMFLLANEKYVKNNEVKPIAMIIAYDLFVGEPINTTICIIPSIKNICKKANISIEDIDLFEINEAFSHIPIIANRELGIPYKKINIYGGAISMGHPLGCSGARIVATLITSLINKNLKLGCATLCNGSGGATSLLVKIVLY